MDALNEIIYFFFRILYQYVLPYVFLIFISLLSVLIGLWVSSSRRESRLKTALLEELKENREIAKKIDSGITENLNNMESYSPIPRFRTEAYREFRYNGLMRTLGKDVGSDISELYFYLESINEALRRQEELAFGPASIYPNAHDLRLRNISYTKDTLKNIIFPYFDKLKASRFLI
jgi:hypothetical protein